MPLRLLEIGNWFMLVPTRTSARSVQSPCLTVLRGRDSLSRTLLFAPQEAVGGYFGLKPPTAFFS